MALSGERRMGISGCAGPIRGFSHSGRIQGRLCAWMTVNLAILLTLWLALSGVSWAQDPLNDVHVNPPPPAPIAPIGPTDPNAKTTTRAPLEGTKAMSARPNERSGSM